MLFESLMPRSEIEALAAAGVAANLVYDDEDSAVELQADSIHLRPPAIGYMPIGHVRSILGFLV
jgi:hypothetical protein